MPYILDFTLWLKRRLQFLNQLLNERTLQMTKMISMHVPGKGKQQAMFKYSKLLQFSTISTGVHVSRIRYLIVSPKYAKTTRKNNLVDNKDIKIK